MTKKPHWPVSLAARLIYFLAQQNGKWCTWGCSINMTSVQQVFAVGTKEKVQQRYMRILQKLDLVGGCDCGCRGDYAPTWAGLEFLANECVSGEQELKRWRENNFSTGY